jgi:hypothetical protein
VPYLKTNDFFYSGHVGLPTLAILEFSKQGKPIFVVFAIFSLIYVVSVMIFTRTHYVIDILCGIMMAHYIYRTVCDYVHIIDNNKYLSMKTKERKASYASGSNEL